MEAPAGLIGVEERCGHLGPEVEERDLNLVEVLVKPGCDDALRGVKLQIPSDHPAISE
jgi:hypothetical protein